MGLLEDDQRALQDFSARRDPAALTPLIHRYTSFVYSTARREVGDAHLAEDVAQAVFLVLARKAHKLSPEALPGWLFKTTRYASANARRIRARRQHHEQQAARPEGQMQMTDTEMQEFSSLLNDGLSRLGSTDRDAVLMRFLQQKSAPEVGAALGLSEHAVRKRIERAIEKLRQFFAARGVMVAPAVLPGILTASLTTSAPPALAAAISSAVTTAAGASALGVAISNGVAKMIFWAKFKIAALIVIGAAAVGAATTVVVQQTRPGNAPAPANAAVAAPAAPMTPYFGDPDAIALLHSIESTYQRVRTADISIQSWNRDPNTGQQVKNDWRRQIRFDRSRDSFRTDHWFGKEIEPTSIDICNGQRMWTRDDRPLLRSDGTKIDMPQRVAEFSVARPRDFHSLVSLNPSMRGDWCPVLALLMGRGLVEQLQSAFAEPNPLRVERVEPSADDPQHLPGLRISGWTDPVILKATSAIVFRVDPKEFWLVDVERRDEADLPRQVQKLSDQKVDQPIDATAFQFDSKGRMVVGSERELKTPLGQPSPPSIVGKTAPAIDLKNLDGSEYHLAKDPSPVVVVAFAKWDKMQLQLQSWLPKFDKWIRNYHKPVSLYLIASGQAEESMLRFLGETGLSVPVLMDRDATLRQAYKVEITNTFIIHRGTVIDDYAVDYAQMIAQVESLLAEDAAKPQSMIGQPAPAIRLKTPAGVAYELAKDSSDVVVLDFWATWCEPCREAMPQWQMFHEWIQKSGKHVSFYAVNCAQTEEMVDRLWREKNWSIPVLMDKDHSVADAYQVSSLPRNVIIQRGKIVREDVPADFNSLIAAIEPLLSRDQSKR